MGASNRLFTIRPATTTDIGRICGFAAEFLLKMHATVSAKVARQVFQHVLKHPHAGIIVVAEHRDGICAYAYASYEWRSEFGGETMELVEMFVEQSLRSAGVGRTLLNALIVCGRERNIHRFSCQVHPGNSAIERALESCGLDPERRTVRSLNL